MLSLAQHDVEFEGYRLRTFQGGTGRPLLLLHGTGPGTSTVGNFARIIDRLSERYSVLAADLIGFGFSDRKKDLPYFDFGLWSRQAQFLLDLLPGNDVCVFGHSLSGALALKLAIENDRVTRVLTTGTLGTRFPINKSLELTWTYPDSREAVIETTKALVYDRSIITESFLDNRMELLQTPGYKEYFGKMFEVNHQFLIDSACLGEELLNGISADVLMMHGREDCPVPANQTSLVLGGMIRNCDVTVIGQCGHSPSMEHPEKVLSAAMQLFN